ncbi:MAG TPA: heat-inducible transcriptional repressor HrcA [Woeseiaceae bacterium]|nr:heat-inducible transcriptional repressor HrcA [Woeseiaceae bacterium]
MAKLPNERAQYLLKVLIQRFIRDGQPVGSQTIARDSKLDLSPATIRNVMSELEDLGFVSTPHTSAGRVPTPRGYRLFVDSLVRYKPPRGGELEKLKAQLDSQYDDPEELLDLVTNLLSRLTSMAGVVTLPRTQHATLRQIEFLALSERRVLAILVLNDREVQNRILHTERAYTADELQRASNYMNENYAGCDLLQIRERLLADLEATRDSMNQAMHDIIAVAQTAMDSATAAKEEFRLAGETNLMDFAELSDLDTLRRLFEAFSRKRFMLDLLDRSINSDGVQVFIGEESGVQILDSCSVVTAPYQANAEAIGVLGVIGPTRMAYDRVVPIVDVTARLLSAALKATLPPPPEAT